MRNVIILDLFLIGLVILAPTLFVNIVMYPMIILLLVGLVFVINYNLEITDNFDKPSWWIHYDIITDIVFIWALWHQEYIILFWLYACVILLKQLIKRKPYDSKTN